MRVANRMVVAALLLGSFVTNNSEARSLSLNEVVHKVSNRNYQVLDEALRVYQAKESVKVARGELLPSLHIWRIIGAIFDPISLISQDVAPFLVPGNWFRFSEAKKLLVAEKEGYRAVWANQVFTAKALYYQILSDEELLRVIQGIRSNIEDLRSISAKRERLGGLRVGIARELEIKVNQLDLDLLRLGAAIQEEKRSLNIMMGEDADQALDLTALEIPNLLSLDRLRHEDFEFQVLEASPERKQHQILQDLLKGIRGEVRWAIMGLASNSRGVAGGVFDSLPLPNGLGFGTAPSLRITEAEKNRFALQSKGIEETLKKDLRSVVSQYNFELNSYPKHLKNEELTEQSMANFQRRLKFGEDLDLVLLGEGYRNYVQAKSAVYQAEFRYLVFRERLDRLKFVGDYAFPPEIPQLNGKNSK